MRPFLPKNAKRQLTSVQTTFTVIYFSENEAVFIDFPVLRGWASYFFEPFIELIYDTLISVMPKVDPRNLMVGIIFSKQSRTKSTQKYTKTSIHTNVKFRKP